VRAGLGGRRGEVSGAVSFDAKFRRAVFRSAADLGVTKFDPAPLFRALGPEPAATVEGKFNVTSKLAGPRPDARGSRDDAQGDFQLSSKGGVFRGARQRRVESRDDRLRLRARVSASRRPVTADNSSIARRSAESEFQHGSVECGHRAMPTLNIVAERFLTSICARAAD